MRPSWTLPDDRDRAVRVVDRPEHRGPEEVVGDRAGALRAERHYPRRPRQLDQVGRRRPGSDVALDGESGVVLQDGGGGGVEHRVAVLAQFLDELGVDHHRGAVVERGLVRVGVGEQEWGVEPDRRARGPARRVERGA